MTHNRPTSNAERSPDARTPVRESRAPSGALSEPQTGTQPSAAPCTPCSHPPCHDDELCATHEEAQAHAEGEHAFCGPTCETEFPTDMLRNSMLAWAPPGGQRILAELERRAACQPPADRGAICICGHTEAQHVEDACLVCDCGDYLSPAAARQEIARLTQAAAPCADRIATLETALLRVREAIAVDTPSWDSREPSVDSHDASADSTDGPPGGNAEDCPRCAGSNLPYPFICPGHPTPDEPYRCCNKPAGATCVHDISGACLCPEHTPDARRAQYAAAIVTAYLGPANGATDRMTTAAIAVADRELEQLRAERDMLGREEDRLRRDWVHARDRAEQAEAAIARVRETAALHRQGLISAPELHAVIDTDPAPDTPTPEPVWAPPPPGDTREQLPDHLLALINPPDYLSTACSTGQLLAASIPNHPGHAAELDTWLRRMHTRCRINMKFTGQLCCCDCHTPKEPNP